ncbi:MAG TPA: hypothetical protein ENK08_01925 [Chloroflexi bacterium]|nr:hypothetical protein [Chloroflexota bacterium]
MVRKRAFAASVAVVTLTLLLLSACADSYTVHSAAPIPPVVTSTVLRPTVEHAQVELYLHGVQAEETLAAVRALQTATAVAGQATATAMAWEATATAQAVHTTATARVWEATATAQAVQATATAHAQAVRATATAAASQATATAQAILWQQAATATRSAWEVEATSTAVAAAAIATAQAARAEQARLEAERARLVYPVRAYGPWALLFVAFALLVWGGLRVVPALEARLRAIPRDARGDAPIFLINGKVVDPDRNLYPVLDLRNPLLPAPEQQEPVTARDQAVDLVTRGLPPGKRSARSRVQAARRMMSRPYRVLRPGQPLPPLLDRETVRALDAQWKEVADE